MGLMVGAGQDHIRNTIIVDVGGETGGGMKPFVTKSHWPRKSKQPVVENHLWFKPMGKNNQIQITVVVDICKDQVHCPEDFGE